MAAARAHRFAWRRRKHTEDAWEFVLGLENCTGGELWEAIQKQAFLTVVPDSEVGVEWDYAITLAGQRPEDVEVEQPHLRTQTYLDRMMRARGK